LRRRTSRNPEDVPIHWKGYIDDIYYILDRLQLSGIVKDTEPYQALSQWIMNILDQSKGSGNTNTRIHPHPEEPRIIRNYGDQRVQEIRILRNRNHTEFMLTLTINDGSIFGDQHIIIQKVIDNPLEFDIDTARPRLSSEFRIYIDDEALTVRQFLTSGFQNHSIGTMQQYIEERFLANNMMTADIAKFIKPRGPRVVNGQPISSYIANIDGGGLFDLDGLDNILYPMPKNTINSMQMLRDLKAKQLSAKHPSSGGGLNGSGFGLENNILRSNKMKKKFGNTDTQLFEGMLGGSMHEMGFDDDMEGEGVLDWLQNLYNVIRKPSEALTSMPKPIWDFNQLYGHYAITSIEVCREPLSSGLQSVIDRASSGTLLKSLKEAKYDALYHLYANIYLKEDNTGKTKTFRIEKNQRVEILDKMPPPKGGVLGKCMSVPNIKPNTPWAKFWQNTNADTWQYSANKNNCQAFLKTRLEALDLLTPELKEFIMQDIDNLIPGKEIQKSIAKGITNAANILQNIYRGGGMEGDGQCDCGMRDPKFEEYIINHHDELVGKKKKKKH